MADKMFCAIVLRKEVADAEEGRRLYDIVKERMADRPNVTVTGNVSNHFTDEEEPS